MHQVGYVTHKLRPTRERDITEGMWKGLDIQVTHARVHYDNKPNRLILTYCSLGDLDPILKIQFSVLLYRLVSSDLMIIMSSDECPKTLLRISQHQVMAWCRQATSHYMNQCWPRSVSPYGFTRPQWFTVITWHYQWQLTSILCSSMWIGYFSGKWFVILYRTPWWLEFLL